MQDIDDPLMRLVDEVAQLRWAVANMMRPGTVEEIDTDKHTVRLRFSDQQQGAGGSGGSGDGSDDGYVGPHVPYGQIAGGKDGHNYHQPPVKGQQMWLFAPFGQMRQAIALPFTWSDERPSPSNKGDEDLMVRGATSDLIRKDQRLHKSPKTRIEVSSQDSGSGSGSGSSGSSGPNTQAATANDASNFLELTAEGLRIKANVTIDGSVKTTGDVVAGDISLQQHKHGQVMPGGGLTGPPAE